MKIYKFNVGSFGVNNYLVRQERSTNAILIDAGEEPAPILEKIRKEKLNLVYLINTHGHGDHIAGNERILEETGAELLIHELDVPFLSDPFLNLSAVMGFRLQSPPANRTLSDGDVIELDDLKFKVIHTPGHTPGHISLFCDGQAFVGDVIFNGSIGRTDFPLASAQQLVDTIRNKIYALPDTTRLHPGHGPETTVGNEKKNNPFVSM